MDFNNIIEKCRRSDRLAQKTLYDYYVSKLMYIAMRYTSDIHSSKDIIQESMMRFFKSISRLNFENQQAMDSYLRRIVVNESLRWLKKQKKNSFVDIDDYIHKSELNKGETQMNVDVLLNDICSLPIKYRTVFNLYAIEGFSHKEIGEKLGINESSSRSQLTRARNMLKETITKRSNNVERI